MRPCHSAPVAINVHREILSYNACERFLFALLRTKKQKKKDMFCKALDGIIPKIGPTKHALLPAQLHPISAKVSVLSPDL
jgi:hypothetical protein